MKKNYSCTISNFGRILFALASFVIFNFSAQSANAQTLFKALSSSQINVEAQSPLVLNTIQSEGAYLIKDGQLDEINKLKLTLPPSSLDVLRDKKITFEQTHVMVLPIMGMTHFVGMLDVGGIKGIVSFQLGFSLNADQSITFKGNKLVKLEELSKDLPKHDLMLELDFVLKNTKTDLAVLSTK